MDAEKYVKKIVRNLKCTGAKKKEIGDSLLSDIAARREQGEAMEQIMESMGSPEEIAEAFSQNLSDADRKAYKRRRIGMTIGQIVAALVFLSVLAWWMIPKPAALGDDLSQEAVTASVENVVIMLNQNDFDGLQELAVDELKSKLTQETMDEVRKNISEDWGEMQSIGKVYMQGLKQKGKVMVVTQVDAVYENVSVVYTISFDEDLRLGGLYMR
ncbi:MAG: DUF3887 domain-containing protein [Lachnospiraceae bacterium]|nr:DUF3887 domain-containing protein [Lachnospiraceae bacterium]